MGPQARPSATPPANDNWRPPSPANDNTRPVKLPNIPRAALWNGLRLLRLASRLTPLGRALQIIEMLQWKSPSQQEPGNDNLEDLGWEKICGDGGGTPISLLLCWPDLVLTEENIGGSPWQGPNGIWNHGKAQLRPWILPGYFQTISAEAWQYNPFYTGPVPPPVEVPPVNKPGRAYPPLPIGLSPHIPAYRPYWSDPNDLPILQPVPEVAPVPVRVAPARNPWPDPLAPGRQQGNHRPRPLPWQPGWRPTPLPVPGEDIPHNHVPVVVPPVVIRPDGGVSVDPRPVSVPLARPPRGTKERKMTAMDSISGRPARIIAGITEGLDFIKVLYDSVDKACVKRKLGKTNKAPSGRAEQLQYVYRHLDCLNPGQLFKNFVVNQIQDIVWARIGKTVSRGHRAAYDAGLTRDAKTPNIGPWDGLAGDLSGEVGKLLKREARRQERERRQAQRFLERLARQRRI